jgi:hypothetical protein
MRTNPKDVEQRIADSVRVTRLDIAVAKSFVVKFNPHSLLEVLRAFEQDRESLASGPMVINLSIDIEPQILRAVEYIRWRLAFVEAIWGLCHAGILLAVSESLEKVAVGLGHTDGRYSGSLNLPDYPTAVPARVRLAPSAASGATLELSDGDLYLAALDIPNLEPEIAVSLREAVKCFRHELYLPCLAMLARASEGAWTELGLALLKAAPEHSQLPAARRENMRLTIEGSDASVLRKMRTVLELYKIGGLFAQVQKESRSSAADLEGVSIWSDAVRNSRNAVHYGVEPAMQNSYEKVGVLLLATAQHLRTIYSIRGAIERQIAGHNDAQP